MDKKTIRPESTKKDLISRLNRIEGQIRGISKMIEDDRYCGDILIQLSAVDSSIKSLSVKMLEKHLKSCVKKQVLEGNDEALDEIVNLMKKL
jgi:DNA-binding FrmR family transcriptional regulator